MILKLLPISSYVRVERAAASSANRLSRLALPVIPLAITWIVGVLVVGGLEDTWGVVTTLAKSIASPSFGEAALLGFLQSIQSDWIRAFGAVVVTMALGNSLPQFGTNGSVFLFELFGYDTFDNEDGLQRYWLVTGVLSLALAVMCITVFVRAVF